MTPDSVPALAGPPPMYGSRRVLLALSVACAVGLLMSPTYIASVATWQVVIRYLVLGFVTLTVFGFFERWPRRMPPGIARWAMQVLFVAVVIPPTVLLMYAILSHGEAIPFWKVPERLNGMGTMIGTGLLIAPWTAVAALFNQRDVAARNLELMKSEVERKALDARLRMMQAHIEPHFLFNTLANVRELVVSGSPQAATVLDSLIAYLRAAIPRLQDASATMDQELQLVRSYLELMQMRMPDRLQYSVHADDASLKLRCPPTTLLTLVENAVRHGIDPSEEGGRIDVRVTVADGRCRAEVSDTGAGLKVAGESTGTGLASLRERLRIVFGEAAQVRLATIIPHGVRAEAEFPALAAA
ncbi:MAG TPA: histidine kinase [Usitatibacter sp.]|nr:histidine kinase [Usitatibacter sp.]